MNSLLLKILPLLLGMIIMYYPFIAVDTAILQALRREREGRDRERETEGERERSQEVEAGEDWFAVQRTSSYPFTLH